MPTPPPPLERAACASGRILLKCLIDRRPVHVRLAPIVFRYLLSEPGAPSAAMPCNVWVCPSVHSAPLQPPLVPCPDFCCRLLSRGICRFSMETDGGSHFGATDALSLHLLQLSGLQWQRVAFAHQVRTKDLVPWEVGLQWGGGVNRAPPKRGAAGVWEKGSIDRSIHQFL